MRANIFKTTLVLAVFAALAVGSSSSPENSPPVPTPTATPSKMPSPTSDNVQAEVASKGAAATVRDRLRPDVCSGEMARTPFIDLRDNVTPYAAEHILVGKWADPGIEGIDSSKNDQVQNLTANDLDWYSALDALCNPQVACRDDVCELTQPDIYLKTRIEMRVIRGQPRISAVFVGVSLGGANSPALERSYRGFVTTVTAQLPPATAAPSTAASPHP